MNKVEAQLLSMQVIDVLKEKFPKLVIKRSRGKFSVNHLDLTVSIDTPNEDGEVVPREEIDFKNYASFHGLTPDDIYKEFSFEDARYRVTGLLVNRRKYPIQATCISSGKRFSFKANTIVEALKAE